MLKIGIMGAGGIAQKMSTTIRAMESAEAYAIASRDENRAREYAERYRFRKAYGNYEALLADPEVQLVYIALPHSHHYKYAKMSLEAGKHVLCEKSFTVNAQQARELCALAKKNKLLITEAIWTRYMPSRKMIDDIISSGVIGEVTSLTCNLGYALKDVKRIWDVNLAGGALLDVGVYVINFARMVFGREMVSVSAEASFENGVDKTDSITMSFSGGKMATAQASVSATLNRRGCIFGEKGYIEVQNINNPEYIRVFDGNYQEIAFYEPPEQITGYEYEVDACIRAIECGDLECPEMPHLETIRIMEIMDQIRKSWGYEIPTIE